MGFFILKILLTLTKTMNKKWCGDQQFLGCARTQQYTNRTLYFLFSLSVAQTTLSSIKKHFSNTDPDNYDGPEKVYREWHHWLVVNIPGSDVSKGEVLSGYIGSGPPEGTGIHRYVYILYKQPGKLNFDESRLDNK